MSTDRFAILVGFTHALCRFNLLDNDYEGITFLRKLHSYWEANEPQKV